MGVYSKQDEQLERDIDAAHRIVINPQHDRSTRLTACETLRRLITMRSPEQIAAMERQRGLA